MRKLLLALAAVFALVLPALAVADVLDASDGTLVVRDGNGKIRINAVGGLIGRLDHGRVTLVDQLDGDGTPPIVNGCDTIDRVIDLDSGGTMAICQGNKLRFRLVGGKFRVIVNGTGIDLSAVGHGTVTLNGRGDGLNIFDGRYSLNGEAFKSLPDDPQNLTLAAPGTTP